MAAVDGYQERRAQRRCHGQRQETGKQDRDGEHCGELSVDHADRTAHEGERQKHCGEHQGDADDRTAHLRHRLDRGIARRQAFPGHQALDVLDHHNRIVHQDADRQHHREHAHHVHRETQQLHHRERAQQAHRHHDRRDQGIADVLQEHEHHQEHQRHRFEQGMKHLPDCHIDEGRTIEGHRVGDVCRKTLREFLQALAHRRHGGDRIAAWRQLHRRAGGRATVFLHIELVVLQSKFQLRHVRQMHHRAIGLGTQDDLAKFLRRFHQAAHHQRGGQFLIMRAWAFAQATGCHLQVLRTDRVIDVDNAQPIAAQCLGVHPHPHRRFGAEELHASHAGNTADLVVDHSGRVVVQAHHVLRGGRILVDQRIQHQEAGSGLFDLQAKLRHRCRQSRFGLTNAVLHVHLGDVGIGAGLERDGDLRTAVGAAGVVIQHVARAVELLLDDTGHRVVDDLGRRAGIGGRNADLRRRHFRIFFDRQGAQCQQAGERDENRNHPREVGAVDKESGHGRSPGRHAPAQAE